MTKIAILPLSTENDHTVYQAVAGEKQSQGFTPGEALDALSTQLTDSEAGTLIIVQNFRPDRFFTAAQQQRLADLMAHWRSLRDRGEAFPPDEQAELDALVGAELNASAERAAAMASDIGR